MRKVELLPTQDCEAGYAPDVGDPGFQTGVGEDMGIHQSTVSRTFATVVEDIVAKADTWIQFPVDPADFQAAKDGMQNKFVFPCAIGATRAPRR